MKTIKKTILALIVALSLFTTEINAQENNYGVKAGLNYTTLGGNLVGFSGNLGYHLGAYGRFGVTERFALKTELLFSSQGAQFKEDFKMRFNYKYVNIPILGSIAITERFFIEVGPQVGILMGANIKDESEKESIRKNTYPIDFGIASGLNYELESGINFGIRYIRGLSNIHNNERGENLFLTNQVMQFAIGYTF